MVKKKRGRPAKYGAELLALESFINERKKATFAEIALKLTGGVSSENKEFARYMICMLRKKCKKEGRAFYSVGGFHQILDNITYLEACDENKNRWKFLTKALQTLIIRGLYKYPELKPDLANLLGQLQLEIMGVKDENLAQLNPSTDDADK